MRQRDEPNGQPTSAAPHEPLLMNFPQLARELGIDEKKIRKWVERRKIPFVKLGGQIFFARARIRTFLDEATVEPTEKK
jgi:excisionase family DNA binding protein